MIATASKLPLIEQKEADSVVVSCGDCRLQRHIALNGALERSFGTRSPACLKQFGGALSLVESPLGHKGLALLEDLELSVQHQNVRHIVLLTHEDCLACKLAGNEFSDFSRERDFHTSHLLLAGHVVRNRIRNEEVCVSLGFCRFKSHNLVIESFKFGLETVVQPRPKAAHALYATANT